VTENTRLEFQGIRQRHHGLALAARQHRLEAAPRRLAGDQFPCIAIRPIDHPSQALRPAAVLDHRIDSVRG